MENNIIPSIYKPTRVTHTSATLIDNIYVDSDLCKSLKSHIITTDISDHFMCLTCIQEDMLERNTAESLRICKITDSTMRNINASLSNRNWFPRGTFQMHLTSQIGSQSHRNFVAKGDLACYSSSYSKRAGSSQICKLVHKHKYTKNSR